MVDWSALKEPDRLSLPDRLSIQIERMIMDQQLSPGDKMPAERELAAQLEVSRVSIRQALKELESRGLIQRTPGRGTIVLDPSSSTRNSAYLSESLHSTESDIFNIIELRKIHEPGIASLAAIRSTRRDISQLENLLAKMTPSLTIEEYAALDRVFHLTLAHYTHNPLLISLGSFMSTMIDPIRNSALQSEQRQQNSIAEHQRIFEAIKAKDSDLAAAEALNHVNSVSRSISKKQEQDH